MNPLVAEMQQLEHQVRECPPIYREGLFRHWLAEGRLNYYVVMDLRRRYPPTTSEMLVLKEPTVEELLEHFEEALKEWKEAGYPLRTKEQYKEVSKICEGCPLWDGKARLGLGKCNSAKCGCTRFMRWLATSECPEGKWKRVSS